jgi:glutamine amidotransferase
MIVIVDYGMGNLGSIENMLKKIGVPVRISANASDISSAEKLILPGVGSFDRGMANLHERGLVPLLNAKVMEEKTPILGICLGMQLFTKQSEEGASPGLGWIDAQTVRFKFDRETSALKVPHMGWNTIEVQRAGSILDNLFEEPRFYFVHSYFVHCNDPVNVLATTCYGTSFHSAIMSRNIVGTQFHPEKSHKYGLRVLQNFAEAHKLSQPE